MKLTFVTTNRFKFEEAADVLQSFDVELEWLNQGYEENHETSLAQIAATAAEQAAAELRRPVVVEDTGLFFKAYRNFPGTLPKLIFQTIGYKGIFKLLEGEKREAYFETVVGLGYPQQKAKLFSARMKGRITEKIWRPRQKAMAYDRIFIADGYQVPIVCLSLQEKNTFSQRSKAFKKLGLDIQKNLSANRN